MRDPDSFECIALNCCGFNSKMENGIFDGFLCNFDLICLSETETQHADLNDSALQDTHYALNSDLKNAKKLVGSHGVLVLVRNKYEKHVKLLTEGVSKNTVWFLVDREVLGKKTLFGAVYIPCERGKYPDNSAFADLRNDIDQFKEQYDDVPICLLGDFNSRTGRLQDFVDLDTTSAETTGLDGIFNDLQPIPSDLTDVNLLRANADWGVNKNGRQLIEFCKNQNLRILNGRACADREIGKITCHNRNGGKVVLTLLLCPLSFCR